MTNGKLKIVLIGAGSRQFSRGLVRDLLLERELIESHQVSCVFVDLSTDRLRDITEYARGCAQVMGASVDFSATTNREEALEGADFVLLSVAVERMDLWEQDFRVPLAFGVRHIYGENGGPGAMFHALRNIKIIMPICRDIEQRCPDSILINFTNPEARILSAILNLTNVKAIGLCHGFYDLHEMAAEVLDRPLLELDVRTAGMNHFFTYYRIADRTSHEDLRPEFEKRMRERQGRLPPLTQHFWDTFGVLGICSDTHLGEYIGYADELTGLRWPFGIESRRVLGGDELVTSLTAYKAWEHRVDVRTYLERHQPAENDPEHNRVHRRSDVKPSGELAIPIIVDFIFDRGAQREAVNVLNSDSYIKNLAPDGCIEVPAMVDARGIHPEHVGELPEGFAAHIRVQHSIHKLIQQAFVEKRKHFLLQALLLDPVVHSARNAAQMLDCMLDLQAEYLPELH